MHLTAQGENKMAKQIPLVFKDEGFTFEQIGKQYPGPQEAFKEIISNSIDAKKRGEGLAISIEVDKRNVYVLDNAGGMSLEELILIPQSVGASLRKNLSDKIGRRQMGFLAFQNYGEACRIFTRRRDQKPGEYSLLILDSEHIRKKIAEIDSVSEKDLKFYGITPFSHGTLVMVDRIPMNVISSCFAPNKLAAFIGECYSPLLRGGEIEIDVKQTKESKIFRAKPLTFKGEKIIDREVEFEYRVKNDETGKEELRKGKTKLLIYVNPEKSSGRIHHYHNGLRINSLSFYDALKHEPWINGKLLGEIVEDYLPLNSNSTAPDFTSRRWERFLDISAHCEPEINIALAKTISHQISRDERYAENLLKVLDSAYKNFYDRFKVLVSGKGGELVRGTPDGGTGTTHGGGKNKPTIEAGSDTIKPDDTGEVKEVRRGRRTISGNYNIVFEPFDLEENHIESELVNNIIRINSSHGKMLGYEARGDSRGKKDHINYLVTGEISLGEYLKARELEHIHGNSGLRWMVNLRNFLFGYLHSTKFSA